MIHCFTKKWFTRILLFTVILFPAAILSCSANTPAIPSITASSGVTPVSSPIISPSAEPGKTQEIEPNTTVSLLMDVQNVKSGDSLEAKILIETKSALRGAQWNLSFNPQVLRCEKVTEGSFFKDWAIAHNGETILFPEPEIDNAGGHVSDVGIAILSNQEGGVSGQGIVCTYSFTALSQSVEIPVLSDVQVADVNGKMSKVIVIP